MLSFDWVVFKKIDFKMIFVVFVLMIISLMTISSYSQETHDLSERHFLTHLVTVQMNWFLLGWVIWGLCVSLDYNKIREWTWILYLLIVLALLGIFFTTPIQHVHRWYRLPMTSIALQPSEFAKLFVVIALSWYLEKKKGATEEKRTIFFACLIVFIPFILILKQPDLGTALVLFPMALVIFYLGGLPRWVIRAFSVIGIFLVAFSALFLTGLLDHEQARPVMTRIMKEYQYERLDPNTRHQYASTTAIALGGVRGKGWYQSDFASRGWLPAPYTDSVFSAFGEEFGLVGLIIILVLFYFLIYFGFRTAQVAKDHFGRLLAAGITTYLAMHVLINVGMMCGLLPITGVPLLIMTYGGSSVLTTMAALGILQSIYSRRFMF